MFEIIYIFVQALATQITLATLRNFLKYQQTLGADDTGLGKASTEKVFVVQLAE